MGCLRTISLERSLVRGIGDAAMEMEMGVGMGELVRAWVCAGGGAVCARSQVRPGKSRDGPEGVKYERLKERLPIRTGEHLLMEEGWTPGWQIHLVLDVARAGLSVAVVAATAGENGLAAADPSAYEGNDDYYDYGDEAEAAQDAEDDADVGLLLGRWG